MRGKRKRNTVPNLPRLVITRFGVVLSLDGGAMQQMLRPLQATKIATAIGPGTQAFPWISIRDLCRAMEFFITPMGKAYRAWTTMVAPQRIFRILYGEAASFLTAGQRVRPTRLTEAGFHFSIPNVGRLFRGTDHSTVTSLDLHRYMGLWYEIARYENRFEYGLVDVTAPVTRQCGVPLWLRPSTSDNVFRHSANRWQQIRDGYR